MINKIQHFKQLRMLNSAYIILDGERSCSCVLLTAQPTLAMSVQDITQCKKWFVLLNRFVWILTKFLFVFRLGNLRRENMARCYNFQLKAVGESYI